MSVEEMEEYEQVMLKLLDALPPEKRLLGLTPEQRLAGLAPEQAILALPDEVLRGFSAEYLETLSEATRAAVRARLGR